MKRDLAWESSVWRSRGYIPHFDGCDRIQAITIRLHDAVPEPLIEQWKTELNWIEKTSALDRRKVTLRRRIATYEDAGHGACWLREDRIAATVKATLLHFDGERYRILAWCVMLNQVHVVVEFCEAFL
jgi:hypothetical protein